jgi:glycosyltransferase involved in cell wall biosynthesis
MDLSIVIPVMDEEENIESLLSQLEDELSRVGKSYEIIAIDDGSKDRTYEILKGLHQKIKNLKVIRFPANFGQTAALAAGFDYAEGDIVITMDADLQNDPQDIPKLLEKLGEGYDVVSGWRKKRKDSLLTRRIPSSVANKLISLFTGVHLHDYGCTLKAYRKEIIKSIELYGEMHRFIPALTKWFGAKIAEVEVRHHPRKYGKSKYGISRVLGVILDLITVRFLLTYSTRPIQIFGLLGLISGLIGSILAVHLSVLKLFFKVSLANRPLLLLAVFLIFIGIQFISMGLLGEMQARTYHESQSKPIYVIKEILEVKKI